MFGSNQSGAKAYAKVGVETGVGSASPHKLIAMLFEGAIISVNNALELMKAGDVARKGAAISKAIMILESGLRASLNKGVGGEIAINLDALYEYMSMRLLTANLQNNPDMLEEVLVLLRDLMGAWEAIAVNLSKTEAAPGGTATPETPKPAAAYDALAPRSTNYVSA
jgi:flagellar protein FliS